jgi:excisionase family DNA binding protein
MPSYLTTADVAARLGVSLDTVRRWLRSGELKGTPFGRAGYRIEDADLQAFLDQRRQHYQELSTSPSEYAPLPHDVLEELMSAMGRDLRTPLITTQGTLQQARRLLQRTLASPLPGNAIDQFSKLHVLLIQAEQQISAEMRLVGNLLDASRIEANTFELSLAWYNLVDIVREVVNSHQELTDQRTFELELPSDDLVAVVADADQIKQALTNYVANARKFSRADQPIKVSLQVKDRQAYVSVRDEGSGIPASEQKRIWERFQQGQQQPDEAGGGLGLGLYVTRAIIQQHKGMVGVDSHPGEGATFWFTLPLAMETWH